MAIKDTQAQHSSKFLTQLEKDVLHDYGLQKDHVLMRRELHNLNLGYIQT